MVQVLEINRMEQLAELRPEWGRLLDQTPGANFFQSLAWLEIYWRHFGKGQKLRVMVVLSDDERILGILPLAVRRETTRVGQLRTLTFPLHDWGSFYGPIGPDPGSILLAGLEHLHHTRRDWDMLELRWQGGPDTNPFEIQRAMMLAGFQAYPTVWEQTAVVDLTGNWESYWAGRKGSWLRRFRHAEHKLAEHGELSYLRYRPRGIAVGDGDPRWDLYDACEEIARLSWQGGADDGTTLSHDSVRKFLRESHEAAAAAGAVDVNLLLLDGEPAAFIYAYHWNGYVYGLRRGYDANRSREGAGNVLLAYTLRDSFQRGDRIYDMGVGSMETKRYFQTRRLPIWRFSHFPPLAARAQLLRLKRWWQSRQVPASIAVGRAQDNTTDPR